MAKIPEETIRGTLIIIPEPLVPIRQIHIRTDTAAGRFGLYFTEDGGTTFRPLLLVPTAETRDLPGSFLTLDDNRGAQWVHNPLLAERARAGQFRGIPIPLSASHSGALFTDAIFGLFRSPRGKQLRATELHLSMQTPADRDVFIEVVDNSGTKLPNSGNNWIGQIATGQRTGMKQFSTPLTFSEGLSYRLKINQCGTAANPGEVVETRLVCELVS